MNLLMSYLLNGWKWTGLFETTGVRIPWVELERRTPATKFIPLVPAEWDDFAEGYYRER